MLFRSSSSALKLGQSAGLSPENRISYSSRENQEKGENCRSLFSSLVFIALVLHEVVTSCNKYESKVLQGRVTKRYKEESQCYKTMSLCITRKQTKRRRRCLSQQSVTVCDKKGDCEELLLKRINERFNQCPDQEMIAQKRNQDQSLLFQSPRDSRAIPGLP